MTIEEYFEAICDVKKELVRLQRDIEIEPNNDIDEEKLWNNLEDSIDALRNIKEYINEVIFKRFCEEEKK